MGWTPHSTAELVNAGVSFGADKAGLATPVVIGASPVSGKSNLNPVAAMAASGTPISIKTGSAAKETSTINANVGEALGSVGALTGLNPSGLEELIMKNTDKNNAWSAAQAERQMEFQERMQGISQEFNAAEAAKNREWQEIMSNTAHQREVADLKAAGLNPILSASGGNGASVGSGSTASVGQAQGAKGDTDESGNSALVAIYSALINAQTQMANATLSAKTNLAMAEMQKEASMYGSALAAEASIRNAGTAYAASIYGADNQYRMQQSQQEWSAAHPSNPYQLGASIANSLGMDPSNIGNSSSAKGLGAKLIDAGQRIKAIFNGSYREKYS